MSATNRICILAAPRTGSSLLRSLLDSQEDVTFAGEVFHPKNVQLPRPLRRAIPAAEQTREARDADPVGFLERCVEACPTTVFGFKHFQSHADAVRDLVLERPEWRIVLLYRENFLAVYASRLAARASGAWSATGPTPAGEAEEGEAAEAAAAAGPAAPRRAGPSPSTPPSSTSRTTPTGATSTSSSAAAPRPGSPSTSSSTPR